MTGGIVGLYELKDGGWRLAVNCQLNKLLQLLLATDDDDDQQQKKTQPSKKNPKYGAKFEYTERVREECLLFRFY